MSDSTFQIYFNALSPSIPLWHWFMIGAISVLLTVGMIGRHHLSAYRAIALGVAVFTGLYILDALALIRIGGHWVEHPGLDLGMEIHRIVSGSEENLFLILFNLIVFIPFGFALSEFLITSHLFAGRCFGYITIVAFVLSLCIESLQFFFRVGIFELTDLVLNTTGAVTGAGLSLALHKLVISFQNRHHKLFFK